MEPDLTERLALAEQAPRYNAWIFSRCLPYLGERVLDFGAGTGTYTKLIRESGRDVVAFEPHPAHAALLRERCDVEVLSELVEGRFDTAVCINVLEHIADDEDALERIRGVCEPGARLLALVPAHSALYGENDRQCGHVRRYAKRELDTKLRGAGFRVRELRHVNPVGAIGWFMSSRALKRGEITSGSLRIYDAGVPLLRLLDHLRLPVGLSLWAVAEA